MDADSSLDHVFFPDSGVVSVVAVYADGNIIEMATIGREGCTGVQAVFGAKISSFQLLVQIPGSAAKMSRVAFTRAMQSMPSFRSLMFAQKAGIVDPGLALTADGPFASVEAATDTVDYVGTGPIDLTAYKHADSDHRTRRLPRSPRNYPRTRQTVAALEALEAAKRALRWAAEATTYSQ
jgi:hypothetical protein